MFNFWYSERCTRTVKLIICIITIVLLSYCSSIEKLETLFSCIALLIGMSSHFLRLLQVKFSQDMQRKYHLNMVLNGLPWLALLILVSYLPSLNWLALAIQVLGFSALGLLLVSHYSQRSKLSD